jgi:ParB family chromosome partitioning protein
VLELEELLSAHLNTRVKVDMSARRGRVVVEFATLEDLERIYKLMVGVPSAR